MRTYDFREHFSSHEQIKQGVDAETENYKKSLVLVFYQGSSLSVKEVKQKHHRHADQDKATLDISESQEIEVTPSGMIQVTLITIGFFRDLIVIDSQEGLLNTNLVCPFVRVSEMKQEVSMRDNG
jgi:hypothetical protein